MMAEAGALTDMEVVRLVRDNSQVSPAVRGRVISSTAQQDVVWRVPEETPVALLLNGGALAVMMVTPADLEDFAVGFALTEGVVESAAEIRSLRIADVAEGLLLNLVLAAERKEMVAGQRRALVGRSGCGICGAQTIGAALPRIPKVSGTLPSKDALRAAYAALPLAQTMNAENRSTHAAAYCDGSGSILIIREDIGRHNALDKLGGALVRSRLDAREGFILLSSRISVEMVHKAAIFGAPFLAAVSGPSALALRQASEAGMGLACCSKDSVMVFDTVSINDNVTCPVR